MTTTKETPEEKTERVMRIRLGKEGQFTIIPRSKYGKRVGLSVNIRHEDTLQDWTRHVASRMGLKYDSNRLCELVEAPDYKQAAAEIASHYSTRFELLR